MTDNICDIIVQHLDDEDNGRDPTVFAIMPGDRLTVPPPKNYEIDFVLETAL